MKTALVTLFLCVALCAAADDLVTITGVTYKNARITGHDAIGLKIIFEDGSARVRFRDLPEEIRAKYNYDPVAEEAQIKKEAGAEAQRIAALQALHEQQAAEIARQNSKLEANAKPVLLKGRLLSATQDGLLLVKEFVVPGVKGDEKHAEIYLLQGYPDQKLVENNQEVTAMARPAGVYKYSAGDGTLKTVRAYRFTDAKPDSTRPPFIEKSLAMPPMLDQPPHR